MRNYIKFGKFHKYIFYIFLSFFFQVINEAIYGLNYFDNIFDEVKIFHNKGHEYFSKHILIHFFFSYIGLFIFEVPFVIYEVQKNKKINSKKISIYDPKLTIFFDFFNCFSFDNCRIFIYFLYLCFRWSGTLVFGIINCLLFRLKNAFLTIKQKWENCSDNKFFSFNIKVYINCSEC